MQWVALLLSAAAWSADGYKKAPAAIQEVLQAPGAPQALVNPTSTHLLLARMRRYPPIAEVAQPMLRLAGQRVNPRNNGMHLGLTFVDLTLVRLRDGKAIPVTLPANAKLTLPRWSPDGKRFAFTHAREDEVQLWIGDAETGQLRAVPGVKVNGTLNDVVQWMPGSGEVLVKTVAARQGAPPRAPEVPVGPNVQESTGKAGPVRTYQDLLTSAHDMDLFDYYMSAQLMLVDAGSGQARAVGAPGVFSNVAPSPDGRYVQVTRVVRPYSLLHTYLAFPREISVWDRQGKVVRKLFDKPLEDRVPIEGVAPGPRSLTWRPDEPATLVWVEALDGGDPRKTVPQRDKLMSWKAPFSGPPAEWTRVTHRFTGIDWGRGFALIRDSDRRRRWVTTTVVRTDDAGVAPKVIVSRSSQDRYRDPGTPVEQTTATGHRMLVQSGTAIYLRGSGATPTGARPFLDRYDVASGETKRLFRSTEEGYEQVVTVLNEAGTEFLTSKESESVPPNFYVRRTEGGARALTQFTDPTPQIRGIQRRLVNYQRPDGVKLSFTLYLPPGYQQGTRLPTVVWAYPREFEDAEIAGQFGGSTQRFTTLTGTSHLFLLLAGYAILDDASMPVVGAGDTVNDTYVEQIAANAKAAIDKAVELGVTDPERVGVGGHSYGAFMTANLLAHTDLFRAGIARSGAYNRTLTPFGFQSERRTLWEAPQLYMRMSPFLVAHKINEPLLLIHGEADNNAGTFPIQSDRMYQAVRGNGGTVRLVFLPHESHGYVGRESVEHTLAEMIEWFDRYVKNGGSKRTPASPAGQ